MHYQMGRLPTPDEQAAILYRARQMRAEFVHNGLRKLYHAVMRGLHRSPRAAAETART